MLRTTIIAALALTATPVSAAEPAPQRQTVRVQTTDLDLSNKAGVAALDRRISAAVRTVCPFQASTDLPTLMTRRACMRDAHRSAEDSRDAVIARSRQKAGPVAVAAR